MKCEKCGQPIVEVIPPRPGPDAVYTEELADEILTRIAHGESLAKICDGAGMPSYMTVLRWRDGERGASPSFGERYARAREDAADWLADQMLETARNTDGDWVKDPETGEYRPDHYTVQRCKLILEQMRWSASKLKPREYGERIAATIDGTLNHKHQHVHIDATQIPADQREQLRALVLPMLRKPES